MSVEAPEQWYALHTRPRHEKIVNQRLSERGVQTFLPLIEQVRRWSDRKKILELPLFSGYVFAKCTSHRNERLKAVRVDGVLELVGGRGEGSPIPEDQVEAVRTLLGKNVPWSLHPYLEIGQRVRITSGPLNGVEGILMARQGERTLVISVNAIQRSLAIRVEGCELEALK